MSAKKEPQTEYEGITDRHREIMLSIGYVHESDVEIITTTSPVSRKRWKSPVGVMFGCEKYYSVVDIKRSLDAKLTDKLLERDDTDNVASLM